MPMQSNYQSGMPLKRSMQLVPPIAPLKNTPAAEKMDFLATGGNPAGTSNGRGVRLWGNSDGPESNDEQNGQSAP